MNADGLRILTVWNAAGGVSGTMGIITGDYHVKGEVLLTDVWLAPGEADRFPHLLQEARLAAAQEGIPSGTVARLGLRPGQLYLESQVLQAGFTRGYRILEFRRDLPALEDWVGTPPPGIVFRPLSGGNLGEFSEAYNASFAGSPHGGVMSPARAAGILAGLPGEGFAQVGYADGLPAAIFHVNLEKGTGWVEALGVHPVFRGRGVGEAALRRGLAILKRNGAGGARLRVMENNIPAVRLYRKNRFVPGRTISVWYQGIL